MANKEKVNPVFLNNLSELGCIHDYKTRSGDNKNYKRLFLPFENDKWGSVIVPTRAIKESSVAGCKNIMLFDKKEYFVLIDSNMEKRTGADIVNVVSEERKKYHDAEAEKAKAENAKLDEEFRDALALDDMEDDAVLVV